jgi:hypothetical protein
MFPGRHDARTGQRPNKAVFLPIMSNWLIGHVWTETSGQLLGDWIFSDSDIIAHSWHPQSRTEPPIYT